MHRSVLRLLAAACCAAPLTAQEPPAAKAVSFLVVGDWGHAGEGAQRAVAAQMAAAARSTKADFVISVGDLFYPDGVASVDDPQWRTSFEDVYAQFALYIPWYVVLGNHEYRGNPQAIVDYGRRARRWRMPEIGRAHV